MLTFCYSASSGRHYCQEDLWLSEDLAHRVALVVENARLYHALEDAARRKDEIPRYWDTSYPTRSRPSVTP